MMPDLTILITSYNKEKYISYILQMLKEQNKQNIEVNIIDDGSTDNSVNIIKDIIEDIDNFKLYHWDDNKGTGYTRQFALDLVKDGYFIFIDADDMITENYVEKILSYIQEDNTADIHHFITRAYPLGGTCCYNFSLWDKVINKKFIIKNNISFDDKLTNMEDYNFRLRIEQHDFKEINHDDVLYIYNLLAEDTVTHAKSIWYNHNLNGIRDECDINYDERYNNIN